MQKFIEFLKDRIAALVSEESAQDGIEYLLVVGGVSVAIIVAIVTFPGLLDGLVTATCDAIETIPEFDDVCGV
jgi:Flp pilus assembly pilin Flp